MSDFIQALDEMHGRTKYLYADEMAPEIEYWILENMPFLFMRLALGKQDRDNALEQVYNRLLIGDEYKTFGLGYRGRMRMAQWQYKDMVKRAGAQVLESACHAYGINRETVINAIFSNDWKSLDELIRYYMLYNASSAAIDSIIAGGTEAAKHMIHEQKKGEETK